MGENHLPRDGKYFFHKIWALALMTTKLAVPIRGSMKRWLTGRPSLSRGASLTWLLVIVATVVAVVVAFRRRWMTDDAFISFRYAENLVSGNGLVFNIGERVEGMSNFLWTLWIGAGMGLG
ncbi:MAG TPA: hypothetical protein VFU38_06595, partial [Candidatus Krumholzibacteria bacterium]|nr:hypothetical protein [Candidatus Krumholzibacteria bacterium]